MYILVNRDHSTNGHTLHTPYPRTTSWWRLQLQAFPSTSKRWRQITQDWRLESYQSLVSRYLPAAHSSLSSQWWGELK